MAAPQMASLITSGSRTKDKAGAVRLGKKVVAEGVETAAHAEYLRSVDCDIAQGYFFGRPMPALNFGAWLSAEQSSVTQKPE